MIGEVRKVKDGLGQIWYEGIYNGLRLNDFVSGDMTYGFTPCRHRWKWRATRHIKKALRQEAKQTFTDV